MKQNGPGFQQCSLVVLFSYVFLQTSALIWAYECDVGGKPGGHSNVTQAL